MQYHHALAKVVDQRRHELCCPLDRYGSDGGGRPVSQLLDAQRTGDVESHSTGLLLQWLRLPVVLMYCRQLRHLAGDVHDDERSRVVQVKVDLGNLPLITTLAKRSHYHSNGLLRGVRHKVGWHLCAQVPLHQPDVRVRETICAARFPPECSVHGQQTHWAALTFF